MTLVSPAVVLAVVVLLTVSAALCRQTTVALRARRDLDCYLRWLLDHATGPVSLGFDRPGSRRI
jgi:hypothetical protein